MHNWRGTAVLMVVLTGAALLVPPPGRSDGTLAARRAPAIAKAAQKTEPIPAPHGLPKIDYWGTPAGFPHDPQSSSVAVVTEALHPHHKLAVYDAPGGRPHAFLTRTMSGLPVAVPIVGRRDGWAAVLLPSVNRRIGWVPPTGWDRLPLRDQLILDRSEHRLTWLRDGRERGAWTVAVGSSKTPTPLGRTFVLGRTRTHGAVYAGLDALVLGAIPDDRDALHASLRNGHTAIHGWSHESAFGRSISNGCLRMPPEAQRTLLHHIGPGAVVHIVE